AFKESFIEFFDPIATVFAPLLKLERPYQDRQWALCVFDDVIEFGGEAGARYQAIFVEPLLNALGDHYPEVRQAAAYGVGRMGMNSKGIYNHFLSGAVERLVAMISHNDSRSTEESSIATENAISAVAKILKYSNAVDSNLVIPTFITWLPIWEDAEETPFVYSYFCDLVEANHPAVLGENNSNLPSIVNIIVQVFAHDAIDDSSELGVETKQRLSSILKVLSNNKEIFDAILQTLKFNSNLQNTLAAILSS
uniref:Uncharacterized protein n=1 Tax=Panagrolaimus sp. ES5 TaxID=591445 RepID=A0AC34GA16_9BILA